MSIEKNKIEEILKKLWKEDDGFVSIERISYNKALQDIQYEIDKLEIEEKQNYNDINEVLENPQKYGFEKSADKGNKVEPKFKVGDWVTLDGGYGFCCLHIKNVDVDNNKYEMRFPKKYLPNIDYIDRECHLWTIKDARDGDVLASDSSVFIFKEEYIAGKPTAYCGIMNGQFIQGQDGCWTNERYYPASEEDFALLMHKMKDEGYQFDFVNKELKPLSKPSIE